MRCLIIDNYDSFTWNLVDFVSQIFGEAPIVVRNDERSWLELKRRGGFSAIIISPGPGSVVNEADFHVSRDALAQDEFPVLGVCLGHQGLAHMLGASIARAPVPYHGRRSTVEHDGTGLFKGLPSRFEAVRYHSLIVDPATLPKTLRVTAWTDCGLVMGLEHVDLPKWGVQFHPESILTEHGKALIRNFARSVEAWSGGSRGEARAAEAPQAPVIVPERRQRRLTARRVTSTAAAEDIFFELFGDQAQSFWLDSQTSGSDDARFSYMGAVGEGAVMRFSIAPGEAPQQAGWRYLAELDRHLEAIDVIGGENLPFEFRGGLVGYLSYEMKAVFGAPVSHGNTIPDAVWMQVERFVAVDHTTGEAWAVALPEEGEEQAAEDWLAHVLQRIHALRAATQEDEPLGLSEVRIELNQSRAAYLEAIARCKDYIVDGESYEICLTNLFAFDADPRLDPAALYRTMRRENTAPFGAFLRSGSDHVLSTSPERFLRVDAAGTIQAKPMKGTCRRSEDPPVDAARAQALAQSEKDRAENLMIVDLMRNDLSRVATPGSVCVPKLMDIESFRTVHQMVSTVQATLSPDRTLVDLLTAVFPGGSITGAPKLRSMSIIDRLEDAPRGIYCGSIGYLGYNRVADLNIAIRSLSYDGARIRFGAGGAITFLSDPEGEVEEILLKAEAVLRPIWKYLGGEGRAFAYRLQGCTLVLGAQEAEAEECGHAALVE